LNPIFFGPKGRTFGIGFGKKGKKVRKDKKEEGKNWELEEGGYFIEF